MSGQDEMLQAIRKSHCSHEERDDPKHGCAGQITITPNGYELRCVLCGSDDNPLVSTFSPAYTRAKKYVAAMGLSWDLLSSNAQLRLIKAIQQDTCPSCHRVMPADADRRRMFTCGCGWEWSDSWGWMSPEENRERKERIDERIRTRDRGLGRCSMCSQQLPPKPAREEVELSRTSDGEEIPF